MKLPQAVYRDICRNVERRASVGDVIINLLWSRGVQAVLLYRLAHWCHLHRLRVVSEVLLRVSQLVFTVDIAYQAEIGPGLVLRHPMCVVIGRGCRVGSDVTIFHGVTLGNRLSGGPSRPDGSPVVEDGVLVGTGAKILGPVTVGAHSTVGANSVVTTSIPPDSVAAGRPGKIVSPRKRGGTSSSQDDRISR